MVCDVWSYPASRPCRRCTARNTLCQPKPSIPIGHHPPCRPAPEILPSPSPNTHLESPGPASEAPALKTSPPLGRPSLCGPTSTIPLNSRVTPLAPGCPLPRISKAELWDQPLPISLTSSPAPGSVGALPAAQKPFSADPSWVTLARTPDGQGRV